MNFSKINMDNWERKDYFNYYINLIKCHYSLNYNLDITRLEIMRREKNIKLYPAILYVTTKAINKNKEFRMAYDSNGNLGYFHSVSPSYTIFHEENKTFSDIWTEFNENFYEFENNVKKDMEKYKYAIGIKPKQNQPANTYPISSVPWLSFSSYSIDAPENSKLLMPIITYGKKFPQDSNTLLPISVYVNHAVADGYHTCKLINDIQDIFYNLDWI